MSSDDEFAGVEVLMEEDLNDCPRQPLVAASVAADDDAQLLLLAARPSADGGCASSRPLPGAFSSLLVGNPRRARHVTLVGFTQHGKSALAAALVGAPLLVPSQDTQRRITTRCTVQAAPVEGVDTRAATLLTCVDTPGHPSFVDEAVAGIALADAAVVCVDAAEGLHPHTEFLLTAAVRERVKIIVAVTKVDRYLADMRLPPKHAYEHLVNIVARVNTVLLGAGGTAIDPIKGELLLVSTKYGLCVSIPHMARKYVARFESAALTTEFLAKRFWGQVAYSEKQRVFVRQGVNDTPTFVSFILEPLYKVFAQTISGTDKTFVDLDKCKTMHAGVRDAIVGTFGSMKSVFIDALVGAVPCPTDSNAGRVRGLFTGEFAQPTAALVAPCPLLIDCRLPTATKQGPTAADHLSPPTAAGGSPAGATSSFAAVVKITQGSLSPGQRVVAFHRPDTAIEGSVTSILLPTADGLLPLKAAVAGTVVLLTGPVVDAIEGPAALLDADAAHPPFTVASRSALNAPSARIAVEPCKIELLPQFKRGLRAVSTAYAGCTYAVEETGEYTIHGPGELFLDAVLHDLRTLHCVDTPIRVSDPFVSFAETVVAAPGVMRVASGSGMSLSMVAEAMGTELGAMMDAGVVTYGMPRAELEAVLQSKRYGWDELQAEGLAGFGPDPEYGPNAVVVETLEEPAAGAAAVAAIVQGFRAAAARGPLCGAPLRDVRLSLSHIDVPAAGPGPGPGPSPSSRLSRSAVAALAGLSRQLVRTSLMSAAPRLMEPVAMAHVVSPPGRRALIDDILGRRRGRVLRDHAMDATPLNRFECIVPLVDSFGLETEVRQRSEGDAHVTLQFDHWALVPGDPLDPSVQMMPLQAASGVQLARDFVAKTRRRHGLSDVIELL